MSLDVYLTQPGVKVVRPAAIFVREAGQVRELTRAEWDERFSGLEPVTAEESESEEVYSANITHNLGGMADEAGIYEALWRPEEVGIAKATAEAAVIYDGAPTALRLRQMALVYEMGKNGTTILIPTEIASSVASGAVALAGRDAPLV